MPEFVNNISFQKVPNVKPVELPTVILKNIIDVFQLRIGKNIFDKYSNIESGNSVKLTPPGDGLTRVIHYTADQSGCAFWRMIFPANELLANNKAVVMTLYTMQLHAHFYVGVDAVRLQRQCTTYQRDFIAQLREISNIYKTQTGKGFRIIWEIDDICLPAQDIPNYNICKDAFISDDVKIIVKDIMKYVDEVVVVSEPMAEHYRHHLEFDKISVIPNYAPKSWLDRNVTDHERIKCYRTNKKKPRILYAGSTTHFDVANRVNQKDDFGQVINHILKDLTTLKKYQWVFLGAIPPILRNFIGKGVEFHDWVAITDYPEKLRTLEVNAMIAPLEDNIFNKSKADIKLLEAGALGIPIVAQNIDCYNRNNEWKYLFNSGEEMMQQLNMILSSEKNYLTAVEQGNEYANKRWLKDHMDEWSLLYTTPWADDKRKENKSFYDFNKKQFE